MTVREYQHGRATVIVHRPRLTEKEYRKYEEQLRSALEQFGKELEESRKYGNINKSRNIKK